MGQNVTCGRCGVSVYTTGQRFPAHEDPQGGRCDAPRGELEPTEDESGGYTSKSDVDYGAGVPYQGGAFEMGKNR